MTETELLTQFTVFLQVIFIDIVLAGDNAVIVGMVAGSVDPAIRSRVVFWGIGAAVILRIAFAVVAVELLAIIGLTLAGGLLLLWICWKIFREIRQEEELAGKRETADAPYKRFVPAMLRIIAADFSMSLDNVLAVAGAARNHIGMLVVGLIVSVAFMGFAATLIARLVHRFRFITWFGLAVIFFVALDMIWRGSREVGCAVGSQMLCGMALEFLQS